MHAHIVIRQPAEPAAFRLLEQDPLESADQGPIIRLTLALAHGPQDLAAFTDNCIRHRRGRAPAAGELPLGIAEHVVIMDRQGQQRVPGRMELGFALPGETHNYVGADTHLVNRISHHAHKFRKLGQGIFTLHGRQHGVRTALQRDVQMPAKFGGLVHTAEKLAGNGGRFDRGNPDPLQSGDILQRIDDIHKSVSAVPVSSDIDACYDQFPVPGFNQQPRFAQDIREDSGAGAAAGVRDLAKRTKEIATVLNLDIGPGAVFAQTGYRRNERITGYGRGDHLRFRLGLEFRYDGRQIHFALVADDPLHIRQRQQLILLDLRLTADQGDTDTRIDAAGFIYQTACVRITVLRDSTRIDDSDIRRFVKGYDAVSVAVEGGLNDRGFALVQTTSQRVKGNRGEFFI